MGDHISIYEMPPPLTSPRSVFMDKAAAACAAPALHEFRSICAAFCSLHRIWD